jgi:hypothetical protein
MDVGIASVSCADDGARSMTGGNLSRSSFVLVVMSAAETLLDQTEDA